MYRRWHEFKIKIEFDKRYSKKEARQIARDILRNRSCAGYLKKDHIELKIVTIRGIQ